MSYSKTIVCLANSRKLTGRCVAGKEWNGQTAGLWCRPVSARDRGELTAERWYARTWRDPQLLDIVQVTLVGPRPSGCQSENHLVDSSVRWQFRGRVTPEHLVGSLDHPCGPLWVNGESTKNGMNDRVCADIAQKQSNSLILVQPELLQMRVTLEGAQTDNARRRVRGIFSLAGFEYALSITDPVIEKPMLRNPDGYSRELRRPLLCISLSEKFESQNACYKLIAGVIDTAA